MAQLRVRVTKKHIEKGVREDAAKCPIACRLREMGFTDVEVFPENMILVVRPYYRATPKTPPRVSRFIMEFDDGKPVKPISFTLRGIHPSILEAAKANRRAQMKREKKKRSK